MKLNDAHIHDTLCFYGWIVSPTNVSTLSTGTLRTELIKKSFPMDRLDFVLPKIPFILTDDEHLYAYAKNTLKNKFPGAQIIERSIAKNTLRENEGFYINEFYKSFLEPREPFRHLSPARKKELLNRRKPLVIMLEQPEGEASRINFDHFIEGLSEDLAEHAPGATLLVKGGRIKAYYSLWQKKAFQPAFLSRETILKKTQVPSGMPSWVLKKDTAIFESNDSIKTLVMSDGKVLRYPENLGRETDLIPTSRVRSFVRNRDEVVSHKWSMNVWNDGLRLDYRGSAEYLQRGLDEYPGIFPSLDDLASAGSVLDVGSGSGEKVETMRRALENAGHRTDGVIGLDQVLSDEQMLSSHYIRANADGIPIQKNSLGMLIHSGPNPLNDDLSKHLNHWVELLKPQGFIFVQDVANDLFQAAKEWAQRRGLRFEGDYGKGEKSNARAFRIWKA